MIVIRFQGDSGAKKMKVVVLCQCFFSLFFFQAFCDCYMRWNDNKYNATKVFKYLRKNVTPYLVQNVILVFRLDAVWAKLLLHWCWWFLELEFGQVQTLMSGTQIINSQVESKSVFYMSLCSGGPHYMSLYGGSPHYISLYGGGPHNMSLLYGGRCYRTKWSSVKKENRNEKKRIPGTSGCG